jgi:pyruvate/2-oxoglutarate dehydrogenase complex dihydrolipoamide dehydrogenase (E3) component
MTEKNYDLLVIGAGSAGSTVAKKAARGGHRTALIEKDRLGGTCLNYGCDPTKGLLYAAQRIRDIEGAAALCTGSHNLRPDWDALRKRKDKIIDTIRGGSHADAVAKQEVRGIDVFSGTGRFADAHTVMVNGLRLYGERILIATGNRSVLPPIPGIDEDGVLTSRNILDLDAPFERLVIVGAGPIGMEFAWMFHAFGVRVTVLEQAPSILPGEDRELTDLLRAQMTDAGITIHCGAQVEAVRRKTDALNVIWKAEEQPRETTGDRVLVAAGRKPDIEELDLEAAGVAVSEGAIQVDACLRTSLPHIYAAGDVTGGYPFTHVAAEHARIVSHNLFSDKRRTYDPEATPWVTYTRPALAHLGATETELQAGETPYRRAVLKLDEVPRNIVEMRTTGMVKLLADAEGFLLGAHILAENAGDLIVPAVLTMRQGLKAEAISDTVFPYPTHAQALEFAAARLKDA